MRSPLAGALTWPPGVTAMYCLVVAGTHTPPFMDLVLTSDTVHNLEHALYLITGYLFFLPVIGSEPIRRRTSIAGAYLMMLAAMMTDSLTGIVDTFPSSEVFAPYARTGRTWGPDLVTDLHLGGCVRFIGSDLAMTAVAIGIAAGFIRDSRHAWDGAGGSGRHLSSTLSRQITAAKLLFPAGRADDDEHLAACNAYLRTLGDRDGGPTGEFSRRSP